jgi:hypothetical protein
VRWYFQCQDKRGDWKNGSLVNAQEEEEDKRLCSDGDGEGKAPVNIRMARLSCVAHRYSVGLCESACGSVSARRGQKNGGCALSGPHRHQKPTSAVTLHSVTETGPTVGQLATV